MLTGIGLLAVAVAILVATAVFHMEVKRVYYPKVRSDQQLFYDEEQAIYRDLLRTPDEEDDGK